LPSLTCTVCDWFLTVPPVLFPVKTKRQHMNRRECQRLDCMIRYLRRCQRTFPFTAPTLVARRPESLVTCSPLEQSSFGMPMPRLLWASEVGA
jgi:hypothetical protein